VIIITVDTCWPEILLSKKDFRPSTVKREL
jgi:hypothetical protein